MAASTRDTVTAIAPSDSPPLMSEIVRVYELYSPEAHFRVEINRTIGGRWLLPRVFRWEFFRIQSTFPQSPPGRPAHTPSDEMILVLDSLCDWESLRAKSATAVLAMVVSALRDQGFYGGRRGVSAKRRSRSKRPKR